MYLESAFKLFLALILGSAVGYEREYMDRPAGLRTHILVSIGAALVQIINISYFKRQGLPGMDPMRLGAQVISGIGFLGAGTILKEGSNIKGLTTAASIWTMSCIGLAVGTGLYIEAILATAFIYTALRSFKKFEKYIARKKRSSIVEIKAQNTPGRLGQIGSALGLLGILITDVELVKFEGETIIITLIIKKPCEIENQRILDKLMTVDGLKEIRLM